MNDFFLDNLGFALFVFMAMAVLILAAGALSDAHKDKREACIKAGYTWSPTKYVCTVEPK